MGFGNQDSVFTVEGFGLRVDGLGVRLGGLGWRGTVQGSGFRVWGAACRA